MQDLCFIQPQLQAKNTYSQTQMGFLTQFFSEIDPTVQVAARSVSSLTDIPKEFICSLTHQIMVDPVFAFDGETYEREAIAEWMKKNDRSPRTNERLEHKQLTFNRRLKGQIDEFVEKNRPAYNKQMIEAVKRDDLDKLITLNNLGVALDIEDEDGWSLIHHAIYQNSLNVLNKLLNSRLDINANRAVIVGFLMPQIWVNDRKEKEKQILSEIQLLQNELKPYQDKMNLLNQKRYDEFAKLVPADKKPLIEKYKNEAANYEHGVKYLESFQPSHFGLSEYQLIEKHGEKQGFYRNYMDAGPFFAQAKASFYNAKASAQRARDDRQHEMTNLANEIFGYSKASDLCKQIQEKRTQLDAESKSSQKYLSKIEGVSPLHFAIALDRTEIAQRLLTANANIEIKDQNGATPLFWSVYRNDLNSFRMLEARGSDLSVEDKAGNTLLHAAAGFADTPLIDYLLEEVGLNYQAKNNSGKTPSELALEKGRSEIADHTSKKGERSLQAMLIELCKQKRAKDHEQPLHQAVQQPQPQRKVSSEYQLWSAHASAKPVPVINQPALKPPTEVKQISNSNSNKISVMQRPPIQQKVVGGHLGSPKADPVSSPAKHLVNEVGQLSLSLHIPHTELECQEKLGQGSFGSVYKGEHNYSPVAIKQLSNQSMSDELLHEFQHEVSIMAKLRSPYVIQLYGACFDKGHYSMVIEYMPNGSLYDYLQKPQDIEWTMRYQIAVDTSCGMGYLHKQGIVHGDLKSLNILLDDRYHAKITDFGMSKLRLSSSVGTVFGASNGGSIRWMAPELFEEEAKNTKASDVYSFGMVMWEISARQIPFSKKAPRNEQVPFLLVKGTREDIPQDTPPSMAQLMKRCWDGRAEQRPTMDESVKVLREEQASKYLKA